MVYSPYRVNPEQIPELESDVDVIEPLEVVNVSGADGANGRHGAHGESGSSFGQSGWRGGDAGPSQRGHDAGGIHLTLATAEEDGVIRLGGTITPPDSERAPIDATMSVRTAGYIELYAIGGDGGNGGNGGNGGHGAPGYPGKDATRWSHGSNGGPGGHGGDGGNATSGSDGGCGGQIIVQCDERDTQLLMLVHHALDGGTGGVPGRNGAGGDGGDGGKGGDSHSWTTSSTYTDSQGNTRTRYHHHRNPGGSNGPHGVGGRAGHAIVKRGADGAPGSFEIRVDTDEGVQSFSSRYDLRLRHFEHESENTDCVYEPRERIRVRKFTVENTGGMPTPEHRELHISLQRGGWVEPEEGHLVTPYALAAGHTHEFEDQELWFRIGDWKPRGPDDPLEEPETIRVRATLPSVRRDFEQFQDESALELGTFIIRFPLRASEVTCLPSLAPGEVGRLMWTVTNQSRLALGADSESERVVRVRLYAAGSELNDDAVSLFDESDRPLAPSSGYVHEIRRLDAGESLDFDIGLGFAPNAESYRRFGGHLALELGHIDAPADIRPIQYRSVDVQCAGRFSERDDADLLLVVNHRSTSEELAAWEQIATRLGFAMSTWNLSLEGRLDLEAKVAGGRSLLELFLGKTMVILDNSVQTPAGERMAHEFLCKRQMHAALVDGMNVAFIGEGTQLSALLVPTGRLDASPESQGIDDAVEDLSGALHDQLAALSPVSRQMVSRRWLFWGGVPDGRKLVERAYALSRRLSEQYPDRRYLVIYDHRPTVARKFLWIKKWNIGRLFVRGTLDAAVGAIVHAKVDGLRLHSPEYLLSDDNLMVLLLTRGFDEKLERLASLLDHPIALPGSADDELDESDLEPRGEGPARAIDERIGLIRLVCDAMLVDLVLEQEAIGQTGWKSGMNKKAVLASLRHLRKLANWLPPGALAPGSPGGHEMVRLVARLLFLAEANTGAWELIPPMLFMRRSPVVRSHTRRLCDEFIERTFAGGAATAQQMVDERRKALHRLFKAERKAYRIPSYMSKAEYAHERLLAPIASAEITTDAEVLVKSELRVLSREQYNAVVASDAASEERRKGTVAGVAEARGDLLRSESFSSLVTE